MDIEVSTEDPNNEFNDNNQQRAEEFDKMADLDSPGEALCFNDDIIYIMVSHILVIGVAISSGYHASHFAIGKFFL